MHTGTTRRQGWVAAVAGLTLLLAGCTGDPAGEPSGTSAGGSGPGTAAAPSASRSGTLAVDPTRSAPTGATPPAGASSAAGPTGQVTGTSSGPQPPTAPRSSTTTTAARSTPSGPATGRTSAARPAPKPVDSWTLAPPSRLGPEWREQFVARYGPAADQLGLASKPLTLGPEYAAPAKDGSWWVLDAAKRRVVHLTAAGRFLGAVAIPTSMLAQGTYFQFQLPHVLADGTLVAVQQSEGPSDLLVVRAGRPKVLPSSRQFTPLADDGRLLYGYAGGTPVSIDPATGRVSDTAYFRTTTGLRYLVTPQPGAVTLALPDAGRTVRIPVTAGGLSGPLTPSVEVAAGSDGAVHLLLTASPASDPNRVVTGYATVDRTGQAYAAEPLRPLGSDVDPGTAAHLVIAAGSADPDLVFIDPDGLRVYARR